MSPTILIYEWLSRCGAHFACSASDKNLDAILVASQWSQAPWLENVYLTQSKKCQIFQSHTRDELDVNGLHVRYFNRRKWQQGRGNRTTILVSALLKVRIPPSILATHIHTRRDFYRVMPLVIFNFVRATWGLSKYPKTSRQRHSCHFFFILNLVLKFSRGRSRLSISYCFSNILREV